jgi:hypothetical protein
MPRVYPKATVQAKPGGRLAAFFAMSLRADVTASQSIANIH